MTTRRFKTWGRGPGAGISGTVRVNTDMGGSALAQVIRRLERETRLRMCGGPRGEGQALDHGVVTANHYFVTLGRPLRSGGFSPESEVWFSIMVK